MLIMIRGLFFDGPDTNREPTRGDAVINTDEVLAIVPAGWRITRWLSGGPCVEIALRSGKILYAQGEPKDFVKGDD